MLEVLVLLVVAYAVYRFFFFFFAPRATSATPWLGAPKPLVILDMNKLLLYRAFMYRIQEECPQAVPYVSSAIQVGKHYVWLRPGAVEFAYRLLDQYDVAVWSSAKHYNVDALCDLVFGERRREVLFEFDQDRCTSVSPHPDPRETRPLLRKDLERIYAAYPDLRARRTLLIDDCKHKVSANAPECVLVARPWAPFDANANVDTYLLDELVYEIARRVKPNMGQ